MKKIIAIVLVLVMALSLCACGEKERYPELADMLDAGDYEAAMQYIYEKYASEQLGSEGNGESEDTQPTQPTHTEPPRPTEEEYDILNEYKYIVSRLENYLLDENGYIYYHNDGEEESYNGSEALKRFYADLEALDKTVIDKWKDTEYCDVNHFSYNDQPINWDYNFYLGNFSYLEDVILKEVHTTIDNMENEEEYYGGPVWSYNVDGSIKYIEYSSNMFELVETNPWGVYGTQDVTYDDDGKPVKIKYMNGDSVEYIVTITYDKNGNKVGEHVKSNDGEVDITYEYDKQNRLVKIERPYRYDSDSVVTYTYKYDKAGNMVKEERVCHYYKEDYETEIVDYKNIYTYVYDDNGGLVSGEYKYEDWSWTTEYLGDSKWEVVPYIYVEKLDQYSFTTDDQARLMTMFITYGDYYYVHGDNAGKVYDDVDYVSKTVEFVYGDYWFFTVSE